MVSRNTVWERMSEVSAVYCVDGRVTSGMNEKVHVLSQRINFCLVCFWHFFLKRNALFVNFYN